MMENLELSAKNFRILIDKLQEGGGQGGEMAQTMYLHMNK
jgi:hypothetical protein